MLIWTLILTSQNSTPEYLTGTGDLLSEVGRNLVCCDYDSTILGGSYYSVILYQGNILKLFEPVKEYVFYLSDNAQYTISL